MKIFYKLVIMCLLFTTYSEGQDSYYAGDEGTIQVFDYSFNTNLDGKQINNESHTIKITSIKPRTVKGKKVDVSKSEMDNKYIGLVFSYEDNTGAPADELGHPAEICSDSSKVKNL